LLNLASFYDEFAKLHAWFIDRIDKMNRSKDFFEKQIKENRGVLLYFATNSCSVGEALEPKVSKFLVAYKIPKTCFLLIDMNDVPEFSALPSAFSEPTLYFFLDGYSTYLCKRT
jgi:hypothetical protein